MTVKKRGGRPTRASAKALAGVDTASVDPRAILKLIAADPSAPATARVQASSCRSPRGEVGGWNPWRGGEPGPPPVACRIFF